MKVAKLRELLEKASKLHRHAGCAELANAFQSLADTLRHGDKLSVGKAVDMLSK